MRDLWDDLRAVEIAVDGGKPFAQWPAKAQNRLMNDLQFDRAVGSEIDRIRRCSGCDAVAREEFLRQIEKSAHIGYQDATRKWQGVRAQMERTIRRLWWTVAIAVMASGAVVLAWVVCQF